MIVTDRQTTDRQTTDGRAIAYSERERDFTFTKKEGEESQKRVGSLKVDSEADGFIAQRAQWFSVSRHGTS